MFKNVSRPLNALVLLFIIFLFDTFLTPDFTTWFLYVLPVLLLSEESAKTIYIISSAITVLMIIGYFLPSSGPFPLYIRIANRGSGVIVVWITAFLMEKASKALIKTRISQERLKKLIDILPPGVVFLDLENKIVFANYSAELLFGKLIPGTLFYPAEAYSFYSLSGELLQPQDLSPARNGKDEESIHDKVIVRLKENREKTITVESVPVLLKGKKAGVINVFTNITEREKLEQERERLLAESEAIIKSLPDGLIVYNMDTTIKFANNVAKMIFNLKDEDLNKKYSERMNRYRIRNMDENALLRFENVFTKALRGETIQSHIFKFNVSGQVYWLSLSSALVKIPQNKIIGVVASFTDVTELIKLQNSLAESEKRFRSMFDFNRAIMILIDPESKKIIDANQSALHFYGYSLEDMKKKKIDEINMLPAEKVKTKMSDALVGQQYFIFQHRLSGGTVRWVEVYSSPIKIKDKKILFSIIHDISDRRKAENDIKKLNIELEQRAYELETANKDMESFSYSVSHDLRNPLFVIENFHKIFLEDYGDQLDETGKEYLKNISDNIIKMKSLIEDLMHLSMIGRHEVVRHDINISTVVSEIFKEIKRSDSKRKVDLIIQDNVHASVDPHLFRIAIENILRNAWKFTSKRKNAKIEFGREIKDDKEVLYVKDNGTGFDMKDKKRIFEPFVCAHVEKGFKGTGIGLSIVERVIRRHGGRIWAESEIGKGASFYFTLT